MSRGSLVTRLAAAVVATVLLSPESATPQAIVGLVKRTNVAATYVQGPAMNSSLASGSTIQTAAFGSATTSGNTVICAINFDNSRTLSSVTDTAGNTYTQAVNAVATHLASANNAIYYKTNIVGGSTFRVTATFSGNNTYRAIACHEFTNIVGLDIASTAGSSTSVSAMSTVVTPNYTKEVIFAFSTSFTSVSVATGFTDAGNLDGDTMQYKIVTLMTPVTIDSTLSPADAYHLSYVTFKSK